MGDYDSSPQIADLIEICILDTLDRIVNLKQVGLYRDDGIILIPDSNGPNTCNIQKKIIRAFKLLGLRIQIASNLKIVDFLDVTLNLNNDTFKPFSKNDSAPKYVNIDSNHPRSVLKQIPNAVNQRMNRLSSGKRMFEGSKIIYDEALKNSEFQGRLKYVIPMDPGSKGRSNNSKTCTLIWIGDNINHHHHHHNALVVRVSLTLSRHSSLSFIALGRSSGQHPYPHIAAECMFVLVVLLLHGHVWGSIRELLLWVRPCFSSSVLHVWFHSNRRGRKRNLKKVIWFNLPFCKLININRGKYFLNFLDKHFNGDNPLRKMFDKNTVKISYSRTKNMHIILNNHNRKLLDELNRNGGGPDVISCNFINKGDTPWADDAILWTSYTRHAFPPWNIIMMVRESI